MQTCSNADISLLAKVITRKFRALSDVLLYHTVLDSILLIPDALVMND